MKVPIRQVPLQKYLFMVQFHTLYALLCTFLWMISSKRVHFRLLWNLNQPALWVQLPEKRPLHQDFWLTFSLCFRGFLNENFKWFSATQSFYCRSTLNLTFLSSRTRHPECLAKFSENFFQGDNRSRPKSK